MPTEQHSVGVVVAKRRLKGPWADHAWLPVAVLPAPPAAAAWTYLGRDGGDERYYAGAACLTFHSSGSAQYLENLGLDVPRLWVVLRAREGAPPIEVCAVTADPSEGELFTEPGTDVVETVAMPAELAQALADFVARHPVAEAFVKRTRDAAAPEALAPRFRIEDGE